MKFLLLLLLISACAHDKYESQETLHLLITDQGTPQELSVPIQYTDGVFLFFSDKIYGGSNPFSYSSPRKVEVKILNTELEDVILFSSFPQVGGALEKSTLSKFVIGLASTNVWKADSFEHRGSRFSLVTKLNSSIDPGHWKRSVSEIWDFYTSKFDQGVPQVTFIELNWAPISGGPLGENVLALFSQERVSIQGQNEIRNDLGWLAQNTTLEYVTANYPKSSSPWQEYLVGTYAHELAHLFFGFGKTREEVEAAHEVWFSLGMGMLYDEEITKRMTGNSPALFQASDNTLEKFSKIKALDQRLVKPNTSQDRYYNLDRKKVYAHSKALRFLKNLRDEVGHTPFDEAVKKYVQDCGLCSKGYEDFKKFLPASDSIIKMVEQRFTVY